MTTKKVLLNGGFADGTYIDIDKDVEKLFRNEGVFDIKNPEALGSMKASLYINSGEKGKDENDHIVEIFNFVRASIPFSEWNKY